MSIANKRLLKEWKTVQNEAYPGIEFFPTDSMLEWNVDLVIDNPLYPDVYRLGFKMGKGYPLESPSVQFVAGDERPIPMHPHVYSNGHICLDLLGDNWTPVHSVASVSVSIQSMLCQNKVAERPPDDAQYSKNAPRDPKKSLFEYHDDSV
ncbi:hypothetical protein BABINDRAFT_5897 [Babjeviella inositovora NRRL Y-12698]|uniref:UBC core domain-containing protein n=1 Tax=Babjeviella inositovora NRRL Y-12698 TaxID=984486 RepID=A0A1E3R100_9ASCO|nr:uncharacterized protein BABINDRAFT_5897 [Babjeviella inositovora NRRL Y-12698]ODQ83022.1 hypothetical protein BABINDRAFT_5897 [Babjeviella inositovora NRRL Y-12698]